MKENMEIVKNQMKSIETKVNAFLSATRPEDRPELHNRSRAQSVAIAVSGHFEVTDREGNICHLPTSTVLSWIK